MLMMITLFDYTCTKVCLYAIICTDDTTIDMCSCMLLTAIHVVCQWLVIHELWYVYIWILYSYGYICVTVHVP